MALNGKIYSLAKQKEDLSAKEIFESMIQESLDNNVVVIDGRNIAAGSIYAQQIHADSITSEKIRSDAIIADHIAAGAIKATHIESDAIDARHIRSGAITVGEFSDELKDDLNSKATPSDIESAIDGIEVGGRNLLSNSHDVDHTDVWLYIEDIEGGEELTIQLWGEGRVTLYHDDGYNAISGMSASEGYAKRTITAYPRANKRVLIVSNFKGNIKVEKGNKATDWTPAPEDTDAKIQEVDNKASETKETIALWKYPNTVHIDGGSIYANTITANQIGVSSLSAIQSNIGEVTAGVLRSADNSIHMDLNKGVLSLEKPLTIQGKHAVTEEDVKNIGMMDTEILSGTEIYTDKADDSVVHVEVDGKTVIGDQDNLFDIVKWLSIPEDEKGTTTNVPYIYITLKPNTRYTVSTNIPGRARSIYDVFAMDSSDNASSGSNGIGEYTDITVTTLSDGYLKVAMRDYDSSLRRGIHWIKVEEGGTSTPFRGYNIPSPEVPAKLHDLNNFGLVSSKTDFSYGYSQNVLPNYDFSNGMTNWHLDNILGGVEDGVLKVTPNSSGRGQRFYSGANRMPNVGDLTIISVVAKADRRAVLGVGQNSHEVDITLTEEFQEYNVVYTTQHPSLTLSILTKTTGANYEFKEIRQYVGSRSINSQDNIPEDGLHKIDILLSDSLKSVGSVKDRLFRDSDGLWKVERNVGEYVFDGQENISHFDRNTHKYFQVNIPNLNSANKYTSKSSHYANNSNPYSVNKNWSFWVYSDSSQSNIRIQMDEFSNSSELSNWLKGQSSTGTPVTVQYELANPTTETLDQELQDKLNNLRSFLDSNYVYTVSSEEDNLLPVVNENLKPTLHATFKGNGWYTRFKSQENEERKVSIGNVIESMKQDDSTVRITGDRLHFDDQVIFDESFHEILFAEQAFMDELRATSITADQIETDALSALSSDLGTVTAGIIKSEDDDIHIDLNEGEIVLRKPITIEFEGDDGVEAREVATTQDVDEVSAKLDEQADTLNNYIRYDDGNIVVGVEGNASQLMIQNNRISFMQSGSEVAYISNQSMEITHGIFVESAKIGQHRIETLKDGSGNYTGHTVFRYEP